MNQKIKKIAIALFMAVLFAVGYFILLQKPEIAAADWWDDSWLYRQTVGITNTGTAETDFQVMITVDTNTLVTANKVQSDCDDIRITDINGKLIPHWIEPGTCNTAATKIWTKVPSISTSGDTVYLYYGNSAVDSKSSTADTFIREISGVQGAWDMDGTVGGISTGDTLADSSGNTNTGTASNVDTAGMAYADNQFGQGVDFDGVDDYVNGGLNTDELGTEVVTLSAWVKINDPSQLCRTIIGASRNDNQLLLTYNYQGTGWEFVTQVNSTLVYSSQGSTTDTNWHFVVGVLDSTHTILYIDGIEVDKDTQTVGLINDEAILIGAKNNDTPAHFFNGSIDEVKIYNTALSADEISDLYGTGGDRQGYVTTNYPNKSLVRKYSATISVGSPASEERGPGPVAFWQFDEGFGQTANDSTINANNGTLGSDPGIDVNDPTWQTEDMCVSGKCLKFDGVDDYVNLDAQVSNIEGLNQGTMEGWFKSSSSSAQGIFVLSDGDNITYNFVQAGIGDATGSFADESFWFYVYRGGNPVLRMYIRKGHAYYTDNSWHHFAISTGNGDNNITIDGLSQDITYGTGSGTTNEFLNIDNPDSMRIGNRRYDSSNDIYFNGFIDSVKIYPYARTAAQIKADYASRGTGSGVSVAVGDEGKKSLSDGLVGYWKMDEASWNGTADEVVDASGSGNDGVAVGATGIPTTGAGKFGNGGVFDGVDDYVNVGDTTSVDFGSGDYSYSAWINIPDNHLGAENIIGKDGIGQRQLILGINTKDGSSTSAIGYLEAWMWNEGVWKRARTTNAELLGRTNEWIYVTFVKSGATGQMYINGSAVATTSDDLSGVMDAKSSELRIGAKSYTNFEGYFDGSIDEIRIYNRALSPGEVRDLYNFAPGPVGWWKMDEKVSGNGQTINDSSGYGNTGTTSSANGTGMDCMVSGKYGSACEFDGVDDYVDVGNDISLNITNAITYEAWIKPQSFIHTVSQVIVSKQSITSFLLYSTTGKPSFNLVGISPGGYLTSDNALELDIWSHIAMTYDKDGGTNNRKLYVNGINVKNITDTGAITSSLNSIRIGEGFGEREFDGSIDDVRIYNYARTQAQIMEDYSAGAGRKQPIGHWKFDEGYGVTANNSGIGGSALNGTLTNMASPATSTSGWTDEGKMGKGLVFDGGNDYIKTAQNIDLFNFMDEEDRTQSIWFKTDYALSPDKVILAYQPQDLDFGGSPRGGFYNKSGNLYLEWYGTEDGDALAYHNILTAFTSGVWNHAISVHKDNKYYLYLNGVLKATSGTTTHNDYADNNTDIVYIGATSSGANENYTGSIDDVKIYNYALTEDEVRKEYNQGALLKLGSTGTDSSGNADDSASREYCIPGDTSTCNPPVGRWDFNEGTGSTVNDISGNNNTGTWSGSGSHWTTGKIGKGGSFNGSDDWVNVGNGSSLSSSNFTYSLWFNWQGYNGGGYGGLLQYLNRGDNGFSRILLQDAISDIKIQADGSDVLTTTYDFQQNQWYYFVLTFNGTTPLAYINGDLHKTGSSATFTSGTNNILIGNGAWASAYWFNGKIDDVKIYDYARTPAQIAWDYNRGKPVAHWKFDECQGGTAYDASGNGNDGTITIGATGDQDGIGTCTDGDTSNAWYNGRTGKYNSAMSFDGEDDYVDAGNDASLDITDEITVSAWFYQETQNEHKGIVSKWGAADVTRSWYLLTILDAGESYIRMIVKDTVDVQYTVQNPLPISINTWYHVVGVYNGSDIVLYVNGTEVDSVSAGASLDSVSSSVVIGALGNLPASNTAFEFDGLIDEVKIYNYALTAEQIKTEYNGGAVSFR